MSDQCRTNYSPRFITLPTNHTAFTSLGVFCIHLIRQAQEIEYRDCAGVDQIVHVDIWASRDTRRAVLVLRDLPEAALNRAHVQARPAIRALTELWLPYLLNPAAEVVVLALRPREDGEKYHALVLPLCA